MPVEIPLTRGYTALVDELDAPLLRYTWRAFPTPNTCYAVRDGRGAAGKSHTIFMHRQIMDFPSRFDVDHRDGDGLHNCRINLRIGSRSQNCLNGLKTPGVHVSPYKGVTHSHSINQSGDGKPWKAATRIERKSKHIGVFLTEMEAALGYDSFVRKHHGAFAAYNFPLPGERSALTGLIEPHAPPTPPSYRRLVELQAAKHLGAASVSREARAALGNAALAYFDLHHGGSA